MAFYYNEGAVTDKNSDKALEYAKKALALGHEKASGFLMQLARENVDNFDEKLQFILDINKKLETDINALGTGYVSELGKKYARDYMELEKYYIAPRERWSFLNVCLNVMVDLVTAPKGIVSGDYFIDQFEKLIAEDYEMVSRIAKERQFASRISNLAFTETMENIAAGNGDISTFNWQKIQKYYFPKALELGWDGYYADGTGPWEPESSVKSNASAASEDQDRRSRFEEMDAYDSVPQSESKKGGCYIATAVYGSYDCPEVWTLRRFRDYSLTKTIQGRLFIKIYYMISPALVKLFGNTVWFQRFWKGRLDKMVQELRKKGYQDTLYCD